MTHQLKQLHIEMKTLKDKASSGVPLTQSEQTQLDQLTSDHHEALTEAIFRTY
jgi:hypothetical protein